MSSKIITLNNGRNMPVLGLGTYKSSPGQVHRAIIDAIDAGYRHFDCAWFYGNEAEIGGALKEAIGTGKVKREELFITSKLWNNFHKKDKVVPMLKETLSYLKLEYIDLYLIHWPFAFKENGALWPISEGAEAYSDIDYLETWEGMEECVNQGYAKSIGISNFNSEQIERLLKNCKIKPVVNQVEVNPNCNQKKLIQFCKDREIIITGYCPLGRVGEAVIRGFPPPTVLDPKVVEIAKKHNKTPVQVVLNYLISLGITVIPKSVTKSRIVENINVFDFKLDVEDITYLDSCNNNSRKRMGHGFGELYKLRNIIQYRLSPFEQRAFAKAFSHGLPNVIRRTKDSVLYVVPPFVIGYLVYDQVEKLHLKYMRKNPADYADEK
ncbi:hypothetical protein Trydic_g20900 [Trypoxylus dichotomus]